jgi:hypothetical protein
VEIDHGGFELGMAHVSLDDPQVDAGFEEMGGIGVVQGVNGQTVVLGPRNTARYANFATVDLRASRDFPVKYGAFNVYAEVTNALDRRNPCCVDYEFSQEDGGNIVVDREYRYWLPLVPAFGVLWKF